MKPELTESKNPEAGHPLWPQTCVCGKSSSSFTLPTPADPGIYLEEAFQRRALPDSLSHHWDPRGKQAVSRLSRSRARRAPLQNVCSRLPATLARGTAHVPCPVHAPLIGGKRRRGRLVPRRVLGTCPSPNSNTELTPAGFSAQARAALHARSRLGKCARAGVSGRKLESRGRRGALWEGLRK